MANEIERKFHIVNSDWEALPKEDVLKIEQGYIPPDEKNGTKLSIVFNATSSAHSIMIANENGTHKMKVHCLPSDDFMNITELDAYNSETNSLNLSGRTEARIRLQTAKNGKEEAIFAVKYYEEGGRSERKEFEILIDPSDAHHVLQNYAEDHVAKERNIIHFAGHRWEVDRYLGKHEGLIMADIEVAEKRDLDNLQKLPGAGDDITDVEALRNQSIARNGVPERYKLTL